MLLQFALLKVNPYTFFPAEKFPNLNTKWVQVINNIKYPSMSSLHWQTMMMNDDKYDDLRYGNRELSKSHQRTLLLHQIKILMNIRQFVPDACNTSEVCVQSSITIFCPLMSPWQPNDETFEHVLFCGLLQVCNEIRSLALLFKTSEDHLGAWDVLLGVLEVDPQSVTAPGDTCNIKYYQ